MTLEYRVERQDAGRWFLACEGADGFTDQGTAEQRLEHLRSFVFSARTLLRVVSREVGEWKPVATPLEQAIARFDAALAGANGMIVSYDDIELYSEDLLLLAAIKQVQP